jgi:DNA-binding LacI/PurR family transcriptional regulator
MSKRITRQDVALAAGVSGATVSRVYNNPSLVDQGTVERVRACAATLGFVPDKNAAALRRRSSGTLLFVEIEEGPTYRWPSQKAYQSLYGEIVRAVLHTVQETSFNLQLVGLKSAGDIPTLERFGDFAGILGFDVTEQAVASALAGLGRPVVCSHHGDHLTGVSTVTTDNTAGGALQVRYLMDQGHRSVAYVTGLKDEVRSHRARWMGFAETLPEVNLLDGILGYREGKHAGKFIASQIRQKKLTALACVNDLTALGVIQGLAGEGIEVPRDVAVVGYDNLVLTGLLGPGLPTVEARLPMVYTRALEVLTTLVRGVPTEVHETVSPVLVTAE